MAVIPHHMIVVGNYGITLAVCVSVRLSYIRPSVFSFLDDNLSKCQWIFIELDVCIDIVDIWFGIDDEQILSFLSYLPMIHLCFHFQMITLVNANGFHQTWYVHW